MTDASPGISGKFLMLAALSEFSVGLAMAVDPALVITLILGVDLSGAGILVGRFFGIVLLALEFACWPGRPRTFDDAPVFRGLLLYNAVFALYLAYLGTVANLGGVLLWPAVALHVVVALVLVSAWRNVRRIEAGTR